MKITSAVFHSSAKDLKACPEWALPEFAFIGRSNVGKSSLVNMLTNRHDLAKVSATPGKTRLINFFVINNKWSLVDLPGYGFARVAKSEKQDFLESAADYLEHRQNLTTVFVLIDSRHPPQRIDLDFIAWLGGRGVKFALVFTKTDKQSAGKSRANVELFLGSLSSLGMEAPEVFHSSAKDRSGRVEILGHIGRSYPMQ